ncbi:MAG: hypothetical protein KC731_17095 [Myxococcales bacterium]|nr:hypothetical protein [Myxococcales bacterium]
MSESVTFRDFAGALMNSDSEAASGVLTTLLGIDAGAAARATQHFQEQMAASPAFMMKAMGMRTVVEAKDEAQLVSLLSECFGLPDAAVGPAAKHLLARYA